MWLEMFNVIVTGGTGFLGRNLIKQFLLDPECEVYAVVRAQSKNLSLLPRSERVHIVTANLENLDKNLSEFPPKCSAFYHFAWGGVNRNEIDDPVVQQANIEQAMGCVRAAKALQCEIIVDAGSRAEYGKIEGWFREDAECNPITAYGKAKLEFCEKAREFLNGTSTRLVHARIFSVYGPDDHPWSLIYSCVTKMMRNEPMELGPCKHYWNFIDIEDACNLMILFYSKRNCIPPDDDAVFNVATRDIRLLREFIEEIRRLTNSKSELKFGVFSQNKGSDFSLLPDMGKVERVFSWKPKIDFESGIKKMINALM